MPDYRSLYDKDYLGEWDLQGRDVTVKIARVVGGELTTTGGRKQKRPLIYFEGKEKALVANPTNGKVIAGLYGTDYAKWIGQSITLFPHTTDSPNGIVPCIRVRPTIPTPKATE